MPGREQIPSTIRRSDQHAQDLWAKTHDSAVDEYGEGQRAHRTAFAALKNEYEKVGDYWERKKESGPSDRQAAGGRDTDRPTAGGVDANASKQHLLELARRLNIPGRSSMNKHELVAAIEKANDRATARSRS
ncbi:ChaB family protein [Rathayibacter sp. KR2-224]|uniref:ChaB family protein n=1 Tax=Rathayibacter sp. KR2-224 TaxID=3400913 RepID=UPI003C1172AF